MSKFGKSILEACANMATRRPWVVVGVSLILTALAATAATNLTINTSTEGILADWLPFRQAEIAYKDVFPEQDIAVVVVDAPDATGAEAAAKALAARLSARPQNFEWVEVAGDSPYFDRYGLLFLDAEQITEIGNQLRQARRLLTTLADDPSLRGLARLLSLAETGVAESAAPPSLAIMLSQLADTVDERAKGEPADMQWNAMFQFGSELRSNRQLVQLLPILDNASLDRAGPALEALQTEIAATRDEYPQASFHVTGEPVLRQQELNDAFSGALRASILSLILVTIILTVGIRSGRMIAALLIALLIGAVWTTGLAAISVGRLNLISIAFMVLFFGLGIDFGTHLGLRYLEAARKNLGFDKAIRTAMDGEGPSITLSAICAALAFLSFVPTSYTGLAEFGIISAFGMLVALVITFTLLPALMALMPPRPSKRAIRSLGFGPVIHRFHRPILVVAGVLTVAAAFMATRAEIDTNPLNLQNPNTEAVETYRDLANDPETSPYALEVLAPNLDAAAELVPKLTALDTVAGVRWIQDFVPRDQDAKLAALEAAKERLGEAFFDDSGAVSPPDDAALEEAFKSAEASADAIAATPEDNPIDPSIVAAGGQLAEALRLFAQDQGTEPDTLRALGLALTGQMPILVAELRNRFSLAEAATIDEIPENFRREWLAPDGQVRLRVLPKGKLESSQDMRVFAEEVEQVAPVVTGAPAAITGAGKAILSSFGEAILYTVIAIAIIVAFLRRHVSDVLLVLAPLAVASLWVVAGSAVLNLPFNFANVIVIPLLVGLGVASSIHIVSRARELSEHPVSADGHRVEVLDTSTPLAVLITQLNTVAAFSTLAVAEHRGLFSMGVLLGLAIFFVLIVSLVVLPAFMVALGVGSRPQSGTPAKAS